MSDKGFIKIELTLNLSLYELEALRKLADDILQDAHWGTNGGPSPSVAAVDLAKKILEITKPLSKDKK